MPAPSKRPSPPARMVELLSIEKSRLLRDKGHVDRHDFEIVWARSWHTMVTERAWPHSTVHRRAWRNAMVFAKSECEAAFVGKPSAFAFAAERLTEAAGGMCLWLEPAEVGRAILAAMAYVDLPEDDVARSSRASIAAVAFVSVPRVEKEAVAV